MRLECTEGSLDTSTTRWCDVTLQTTDTVYVLLTENRDNEKMGSARTDYESNHMLCERAKKRRKLLREKAAGGPTDGRTFIYLNLV